MEGDVDLFVTGCSLLILLNDGNGDLDILADNKSQGLILEQYESGSFRLIAGNKKNW